MEELYECEYCSGEGVHNEDWTCDWCMGTGKVDAKTLEEMRVENAKFARKRVAVNG